ncbi:MAG: alanine--glyoxylate aminotransferase family protein [Planctomycetes bacterium]|nr:alanine--glyoxylate aminotransferase family protein [Planctomycetota bacterium]
MSRAPEPSEVLLLGPGPSPVPPEVTRALAAPLLGHLDPEFIALMDRVKRQLRDVFGTRAEFTLPISGTGSAGMEASLTNLLEPGDRAVIGVHGVFGARMVDCARRLGAEVAVVEAPFGEALDSDAVRRAALAGPTRLVAFVHAETSTGVLQPTDGIVAAARDAGALVLADCVTSLGGVPVDVDAAGFDAAFSGTQKCLSVPPGLAPLTFGPRAMERVAARRAPPPSWYLDVAMLAGYWREGVQRAYHHTAPVAMVYALARGLDLVLDEGLAARWERHRQAAALLYAGLDELGLRCVVAPALRLPQLTTVAVPDGVDAEVVRRRLRDEHRIEIGGGLGAMKGRVWRIGLMGHGARPDVVRRLLAALRDVLAA